jgi:hypothetical protein
MELTNCVDCGFRPNGTALYRTSHAGRVCVFLERQYASMHVSDKETGRFRGPLTRLFYAGANSGLLIR